MTELVKIEGDSIVIRIPVNALQGSIDVSHSWVQAHVITDPEMFARDVLLLSMCVEQEDGTTPVHMMLDKCIAEAIEKGASGMMEVEADG